MNRHAECDFLERRSSWNKGKHVRVLCEEGPARQFGFIIMRIVSTGGTTLTHAVGSVSRPFTTRFFCFFLIISQSVQGQTKTQQPNTAELMLFLHQVLVKFFLFL